MQTLRQMAVLSVVTSVATLGLKFSAYYLTDSVSLLSDALEAFINLAAGPDGARGGDRRITAGRCWA